MNPRILFLLLSAMVGLVSCTTVSNMSSIQVEMISPAQFTLSKDMDTIAVFNRDKSQSDTVTFKYHDLQKHIDVTDPVVQYSNLSNRCVDALAHHLALTGKFLKVSNFRDTTILNENSFDFKELHEKSGADVCIILDSFYLKDHLINGNINNLGREIFARFPEFRGSTKLESIEPALVWTVSFKGNNPVHVCKQPEKLFYGNNLYPTLFGNDENHRLLLQTVAEYLGETFTSKFIPSMQLVERTYYRSNNTHMLVAEKHLLEGNWLKAAEIYNPQTNNKNQNIAAKATYNMALICEMEGNLDAATEWLYRSFSAYKNENDRHLFNCSQYNTSLAQRRKEIKILDKQGVYNEDN